MCGTGTAGIVCYVLHFLLPESLSFAQQQCGGTAQDAAYRFAWLLLYTFIFLPDVDGCAGLMETVTVSVAFASFNSL